MKTEDVIQRVRQIKESRALQKNRINKMMNIQLEAFNEESGDLAVSFQVEEWMLNPGDVMHGGMIATAFDMAMGMHTLIFERVKTIVTTNMNIHFIRQIPPEAKLIIHSKLIRNGRQLVNASAEAFIEGKDKVVATAQAEFMKLEEGSGVGKEIRID